MTPGEMAEEFIWYTYEIHPIGSATPSELFLTGESAEFYIDTPGQRFTVTVTESTDIKV